IRGVGLEAVIETLSQSRTAAKTLADAPAEAVFPAGQDGSSFFTPQLAARALCSGVFAGTRRDSALRGSGTLTPPATPAATGIAGRATILTSAALTPEVGPLEPPTQGNGEPARDTVQVRLPPAYWKSVAGLGLQVAQALDYAHAQNVLHRDVKPANL